MRKKEKIDRKIELLQGELKLIVIKFIKLLKKLKID